ncbi:MAG: LacI family transcriptional regulator [Lachnospiraceae bacterium]|nr:LacI family transcriptional regulator [Lachnospiraceae bacterium]
MVSLKDISAVCGVSVATVSKALNNHKDIGEETKKHIKQVAKEMGYLPNSAAKALKTNRTHNIGILFTDEAHSGLTHDYFASVLDSLKQTVEAHGYDVTFINSSRKWSNRMSYLEHARYRGFDGVVIANVNFYDDEVDELAASNLPLVTIDKLYANHIAIISDNVNGMKDLLTYIYEMGHRRIAYIHGEDSPVTKNRLTSFYRTAEELSIDVPDYYIKESAYRDTEGAGEATKELLKLKTPPTCILYPDDFSCYGGINVINKMGLRIPEDISVAGYDGIRIGRHIEPQLTTIKQDTDRIGIQAGEKIISLIEKPKSTVIEQVIISGELYKGATVGKI